MAYFLERKIYESIVILYHSILISIPELITERDD